MGLLNLLSRANVVLEISDSMLPCLQALFQERGCLDRRSN